jgi:hypothetical protein
MNESFKTQAFSQGIYQVSGTKKEMLGQLRILPDGRKFRYACAGETLVAGQMTSMVAGTANHVEQVQTSGAANAVGSISVTVYVGATEVTADLYTDGYLLVHRGSTEAGYQYRIKSHTTSAGSGTIVCTLNEPLHVATTISSYFSLIPSPWNGVINSASRSTPAAGVAMVVATVGQYLWLQTGGPAICKAEGTAGIASVLSPSNTAGEVEIADSYTSPFIGFVYGYANVAGYFHPIYLTID